LVIWEAQFGDFFNGAQIILDTYISTSEIKWMHQSGIVLLLPHGYDGAGPEHTSCRIERFLQSCSSKENAVDSDDINYYIANPTTPANYFHLLRRQMLQPFRKPLIVASPKALLRLPECVSDLDEMGPNTSFKTVISDTSVPSKDAVKRVIFVFGKHYYALAAEKASKNANDVAIVRVEELCPFPALELRNVLSEFKNANEFVWAQEEHQNMGAWFFVKPRFENIIGVRLSYVGRDVSCVPAVGTSELHNQEVKHVISKPFEKL
jgi:probable 2-oxoglutarate dehydrogenase E1 component DHKTD1